MSGGRIEMEETKIGRLDHKIEKLKIVKKVLGTVEAMRSEVRSATFDRPLSDRARALGRDRDGVARHAFDTHDGQQCDQCDRVG